MTVTGTPPRTCAGTETAAPQPIPGTDPAAPVPMRPKYLYRVVVDSWPTPDGTPFTNQDPDVWELVGSPDAPPWLPTADAMEPWRIEDDYHGDSYYTVPTLHRTLSTTAKSTTAAHRLRRVLDLGCTARILRAVVTEWTPTSIAPAPPEPAPKPLVVPIDDEPPF